MDKNHTSNLAAGLARKQAVSYARVSSKEQEKEGFSIPAQLKVLKEYAGECPPAVASTPASRRGLFSGKLTV